MESVHKPSLLPFKIRSHDRIIEGEIQQDLPPRGAGGTAFTELRGSGRGASSGPWLNGQRATHFQPGPWDL